MSEDVDLDDLAAPHPAQSEARPDAALCPSVAAVDRFWLPLVKWHEPHWAEILVSSIGVGPFGEYEPLAGTVRDGGDQPALGGKLFEQRLGQSSGRSRGDVDRVVWRLLRVAFATIADDERHVFDTCGGQVFSRLLEETRVTLNAHDRSSEMGQDRSVVARTSADIEDALLAAESQRFAHVRNHQRLGDRLPCADR